MYFLFLLSTENAPIQEPFRGNPKTDNVRGDEALKKQQAARTTPAVGGTQYASPLPQNLTPWKHFTLVDQTNVCPL